MLIKVFSSTVPGTIHIIEGVRDVVIHMGSYTCLENGPNFEGPAMPTLWRQIEDYFSVDEAVDHKTQCFKFVDYTDNNGVRTRLRVGGYAYICNDDGKTIDKVNAGVY